MSTLKRLVGSGDRIGLVVLPVLAVGVILNVSFPCVFGVGGPSDVLRTISLVLLVPGVVLWIWSVYLILTRVPKGELITSGPYALVRHPLYTFVSLLVLPWAGFLLDTWLGLAVGIAVYAAAKAFAPEEDRALSRAFGDRWVQYSNGVALRWL